ncbi:MAG: hypothetical protein LBQ83_01135 [Candidatus Margulisbacteria bacterium]|jgi:ferrous iron transport protein B|nr:hypothetical protein [Candidatus Margulisiibacteriota bacterium]
MTKNILVIGQNFSGKSDFFHNLLSGGRIRTVYYPQTQITFRAGQTRIGGVPYQIIDAPGIYSLIPTSEYEIVTLNLILGLQPEKIVFVMREETLEASIMILIQLAELGIPFVIGYQVENIARQEYSFDRPKLAHIFNTKVIISSPVVQANTKELKKALADCHKPRWVGHYSRTVEKNLADFEQQFQFAWPAQQKVSPRFWGLMLLLGNNNISDWLRRNYPPELSARLLDYAASRYQIAYSFSIANRWESLARSLFKELWHKRPAGEQRLSYFFEKYSLRWGWDFIIAALAVFLLFGFVNVVGGKILVNLFYNELLGKYLTPFFTYLLVNWAGDGLLFRLFVGPYGLLTTGVTYALAFLLPLMASFFFMYALLENTGYIDRLSLTLHRLLRLFRLNGYALPPLLFCTCKLTALNKARILHTRKERAVCLLLLLFCVPCVSQLVIVANLLTIIPFNYALIFGGVLLAQIAVILNLHRLLPRQQTGSHYIARLTPLHLPEPGKVLAVFWAYTRWYLREVCPLIIGISLLLFLSDAVGLLALLRSLVTPLTAVFLDLPESFTDSIILGLFRKDFSAVSLYDLANNGLLNSIQVLVSCLFISLSVPCLGFVSEIYKQHGWRKALLIFGLSTFYAFTIAALVNKILRI